MNKKTIKTNLALVLRKMSGNIISAVIFTLAAIATVYVYAAFTEPSVGPASSDQDFTQNILGANNADNDFDSSAVVSNVDGSIIERLEYIADEVIDYNSTYCSNGEEMKVKWNTTTSKPNWVCIFACGDSVEGIDGLTYGTVRAADGNCWLDRNLGATQVATSATDTASYGWYYQWGRLYDGHQISTSGTTTTLSATDDPGHANFIYGMGSPYDWRSDNNDNRWKVGDNNPCPSGWRLPTSGTGGEWDVLVTAESITNSATAYSSTLKLSLAGLRFPSTAALDYQGTYGSYWSSSPSGTNAFYLDFDSASVYPAYSNNRAYGFSVRCVKD